MKTITELLNSKCDLHLKDVDRFLTSIGFTLRRKTNTHAVYFHPDLVGHPTLNTGIITIGTHFKKNKNICPSVSRDILAAWNYLNAQNIH